jgi:bifunctional non-homologous end joining protein LigD
MKPEAGETPPVDRGLETYRAKRRFDATPEPAGAPADVADASRFVIQEHHATSLHWDLRLERDGVLLSWAVPKGIPPDPRVNHLAVRTEDHPIEYLTFHGTIPEGNYGAGEMTVWDAGTYRDEKVEPKEIIVVFEGRRVRGRHALIATRGNQWLLHRMEPPDDPSRELLPEGLTPMEPVPGPLPDDSDDWAFDVDWGGHRLVVAYEGGRSAWTGDSQGIDRAGLFPELARLGEALGTLQVVLHADVIVSGDDGRPVRAGLDRRLSARSPSTVRRLAGRDPATVMLSDVLWLDGHTATTLPWHERRRLLDGLELAGPSWQTPPAHIGDGAPLLDAAGAQGLAGVVAKRRDSAYLPGERSEPWRSVAAAT